MLFSHWSQLVDAIRGKSRLGRFWGACDDLLKCSYPEGEGFRCFPGKGGKLAENLPGTSVHLNKSCSKWYLALFGHTFKEFSNFGLSVASWIMFISWPNLTFWNLATYSDVTNPKARAPWTRPCNGKVVVGRLRCVCRSAGTHGPNDERIQLAEEAELHGFKHKYWIHLDTSGYIWIHLDTSGYCINESIWI